MTGWAFQLRPEPDELLSGYLARAAHAHGSFAGAFCRRHLGDSWYFTRDVDRGVAAAQHGRLAHLAGRSGADIAHLTLRGWIEVLTPASYRHNSPAAVTPWINAVGIEQARRRHPALQYCPDCLREHGVVSKRWRLAFHTWCVRHERPLVEACALCSASFVPHLARRSVANCYRCGTLLRRPASAPPGAAHADALKLQSLMDRWLNDASSGDAQAGDRLSGLRVLVSVGWLRHGGRAVSGAGGTHAGQDERQRLELASLSQRVQIMSWLSAMVDGWPQSFHQLADAGGLSQRSFARTPASQWLKDEVDHLPPGFTRSRAPGVARAVAMLGSPDAAVALNWRARRAEFLMRKAVLRGH